MQSNERYSWTNMSFIFFQRIFDFSQISFSFRESNLATLLSANEIVSCYNFVFVFLRAAFFSFLLNKPIKFIEMMLHCNFHRLLVFRENEILTLAVSGSKL